jgi:hypothetical protein
MVGFLLGCATSGNVNQVDGVSSASYESLEWEIQLEGIKTSTLSAEEYADIMDYAKQEEITQELTVERKGIEATYLGISLKDLFEIVQGKDFDSTTSIYMDLWDTEYEMTLIATDGYAVSFPSSEHEANSLVFYDIKDGEPTQPGIIGENISSKYFIKNVSKIELRFSELAKEIVVDEASLTIDINGEKTVLSLSELKESPYYMIARGGYTTSAGTYYEHAYGGIRLADFLNSFLTINEDASITLRAIDGYAMSYPFSDISSTENGIWLLAFEADGQLFDSETGPFRGVRVAESLQDPVPNIDGHSSPKMVHLVEVSQEVFNDFTLIIRGDMSAELDRSTIQAGIQCSAHNTTVSYLDKKSGKIVQYSGIPLFALLAYGDDPSYAPHKQTDKSILSYNKEAAQRGYQVKIIAGDGYSIILDSRQLDENFDVIVAMYQDGEELSDDDWPLKLVWDKDAQVIPEGIKAVKNIVEIELLL